MLTLCLQTPIAILILVSTYQIGKDGEYLDLCRDNFLSHRFAPGCHVAQQRVQAEAETFCDWDPFGE